MRLCSGSLLSPGTSPRCRYKDGAGDAGCAVGGRKRRRIRNLRQPRSSAQHGHRRQHAERDSISPGRLAPAGTLTYEHTDKLGGASVRERGGHPASHARGGDR